MLKAYQYKKYIYFLIVLVCFSFSEKPSANEVEFDTGFSEFILKNASPLASQIQNKSGLGYNSLVKQIQSLGCNSDLVLSEENLTKSKKSYLFHQALIKSIENCTLSKRVKKNQHNIEELLSNKKPYLIVAGESLNSPMSYFGHSLLLFLDEDDFYFSPVVSVLAPTEGLSTFEQIIKGGFSTIEAKVNIIPLHQVIDFYNDQDSRELKFIELPETKFDKTRIIEYFNKEINNKNRYNFFLKNCSTYLYEALEYSCNCLDKNKFIVTPASIEKALYQGKSKTLYFRTESLSNKFNTSYHTLNKEQKSRVKEMFYNADGRYLDEEKNLGDIAVLASMLSFESYQNPNPAYAELLNKYGKDSSILSEMPLSENTSDSNLDPLLTSSIKISTQKDSIQLKLSVVDFHHFEQRKYHFTSSKLEVGSLELQEEDNSVKIKSINLINIRSVTPINFVTKKASWRLNIGAKRSAKDQLETSFSYGIGAAFSISQIKFYILPSIEAQSSFEFPVYSGMEFNSENVSIKYETKNLDESSLSFFRRENSSFGYEYTIKKKENNQVNHQVSFNYYF